jgi:hypothetical protein
MIIWRGFGILPPLIGILGYVVAQTIVTLITSDNFYFESHLWSKLFGILLASLAAFGAVKILESKNKPKMYIDKETNKEIQILRKDDVFFIPVKYLPYLIFGIGLIATAIDHSKNY